MNDQEKFKKKEKINLDVNKNFSDLIEKRITNINEFTSGQKLKVCVVGTSGDWMFVDYGGRSEGIIAKEELSDENGTITIKTGDVIDAYFLSAKDGEIHFTTKLGGRKLSNAIIKDAFRNQIPVEGHVVAKIKGGYEVMVSAKRAFCPFSHMELGKGTDSADYLAKDFKFHILEYNEGGKNLILSRKKILKEERDKLLNLLRAKLKVGDEIEGIVRSIQPFGAFVDLGGIDGLIPLSEMSWGRVKDAADYIKVRNKVKVKITSIDWDKNRISLSLKQIQENPWETIKGRYQEGDWTKGKVVELVDFGAFIELESGVNGLIHISNLNAPTHINHPKEVLKIGDEVNVRIISIDQKAHRISLSMEPEKVDPFDTDLLLKEGDIDEGRVESIKPYGIFVKLSNGIIGLLPNEELDVDKNVDKEEKFPIGSKLKINILYIDKKKKRIKLSRKAVIEDEDRNSYKKYLEEQKDSGGGEEHVTAFGNLLKKKLQEKISSTPHNK
ncbi:MAG: S1 RNA-binding domain-containing protein [bacterium]